MQWVLRHSCALVAVASGCAGQPPQSVPSSRTAESAATPAAPPKPPAAAATATPKPEPAPEPEPEVPFRKLLSTTRVLDKPVRSLAVGKKRVAALGEDAWLATAGKWRHIPLGKLAATAGQQDHTRIFFGRDDRPRMMGHRSEGGTIYPVYLRWKNSGWQRERAEIGRLGGSSPHALFGALGHADPEVVCKVDEQCIIKRLTGWQTFAAPSVSYRVEAAFEGAYAVRTTAGAAAAVVLVLDGKKWTAAADPPFSSGAGIWATGPRDVWVTESDSAQLHRYDGSGWTSTKLPIERPTGIWGSTAGSVWVAGKNGAAHFDGQSWARVAGFDADVVEVLGRGSGEVWFAGASGVWHGTPLAGAAP